MVGQDTSSAMEDGVPYNNRNRKRLVSHDGNGNGGSGGNRDAALIDALGAGIYIPPAKRRMLEKQQMQQQQQQQQQRSIEKGADGDDDEKQHSNKKKRKDDDDDDGSSEEEGAIVDEHDTAAASKKDEHEQQVENNKNRHSTAASIPVQRKTWEEQKRVIHGTVNRLNTETIKPLVHDLFAGVNLIRLRGVLSKSVLLAATSSFAYTPVYAALIAVLNSKLPDVGELVVKRSILLFRRYFKRCDKPSLTAITLFLGHLFHQRVIHELVVLQILSVLLDGEPTDDSVEVATQLLHTTGYALLEVSPAGVRAVVERIRNLLHEGQFANARVTHKMEQLLKARKNGFRGTSTASKDDAEGDGAQVAEATNTPIPPELDLVEEEDQITFDDITLDDEDIEYEESLDQFRYDPNYEENEREWSQIRAEILGLSESDSDDDSSTSGSSDDSSTSSSDAGGGEAANEETAIVPVGRSHNNAGTVVVQDLSEADLVHLRRTIYLTIMSSATFEECTHKLAKLNIPQGREEELINMLLECCSQERTFLRYYGLIASRFCLLQERWCRAFEEAFVQQYTTIHRLETNKLRNVAKLFAHLLHTDSITWNVLSIIHLNEEETTSSSRIFIKILMQEMTEALGMEKLKARLTPPASATTGDGGGGGWFGAEMFPMHDPSKVRNTRYAINFFTSIGLGPLTDGLRDFLKAAPKLIMRQAQEQAAAEAARKAEEELNKKKKKKRRDDDDSSVSSSSSSSSSSTSSSSSSSSSSSTYTSSSSGSSSYTSSSSRSGSSRGRRGRGRRRGSSGRRRRRSYSSSSRSSYSSSSSSYTSSDSESDDRRRGRRGRGRDRGKEKDKGSRDRGTKAERGRSRSPSPKNSKDKRDRRSTSPSRSRSRSRSYSSESDRDRRGKRGDKKKNESRRRNKDDRGRSRSPSPTDEKRQDTSRIDEKKRDREEEKRSRSRSPEDDKGKGGHIGDNGDKPVSKSNKDHSSDAVPFKKKDDTGKERDDDKIFSDGKRRSRRDRDHSDDDDKKRGEGKSSRRTRRRSDSSSSSSSSASSSSESQDSRRKKDASPRRSKGRGSGEGNSRSRDDDDAPSDDEEKRSKQKTDKEGRDRRRNGSPSSSSPRADAIIDTSPDKEKDKK